MIKRNTVGLLFTYDLCGHFDPIEMSHKAPNYVYVPLLRNRADTKTSHAPHGSALSGLGASHIHGSGSTSHRNSARSTSHGSTSNTLDRANMIDLICEILYGDIFYSKYKHMLMDLNESQIQETELALNVYYVHKVSSTPWNDTFDVEFAASLILNYENSHYGISHASFAPVAKYILDSRFSFSSYDGVYVEMVNYNLRDTGRLNYSYGHVQGSKMVRSYQVSLTGKKYVLFELYAFDKRTGRPLSYMEYISHDDGDLLYYLQQYNRDLRVYYESPENQTALLGDYVDGTYVVALDFNIHPLNNVFDYTRLRLILDGYLIKETFEEYDLSSMFLRFLYYLMIDVHAKDDPDWFYTHFGFPKFLDYR